MTGGTPKPGHHRRGPRGGAAWFAVLVCVTCFEGLGRKFFPELPSALFYYAKDAVLLAGAVLFGISRESAFAARTLLRGFWPAILLAVAWTIGEVFNPSHPSLPLALIGLRSYWLWWLAPPVIATALRDVEARTRGAYVVAGTALFIVAFAGFQFVSPADSFVNSYALYKGEQLVDVATVASTGRARVSSTFSYLTGFTDFVVVIPPLLLGLGMDSRRALLRGASLLGGAACLAAIPLSGSRGPLLFALVGLATFAASAGLLRTKGGRWVIAGGLVAACAAYLWTPDAVEGLSSRFQGDDTSSRFEEVAQLIPPVNLAVQEYPLFGEGTGTQQNARIAFGVASKWDTEGEPSRLLVELGAVGYVLVWLTKCGLMIGLFRAARRLREQGQTGMASAAMALSVFAFIGNAAFDHVWQALFFVGVGLVMAVVRTPVDGAPEQARRLR